MALQHGKQGLRRWVSLTVILALLGGGAVVATLALAQEDEAPNRGTIKVKEGVDLESQRLTPPLQPVTEWRAWVPDDPRPPHVDSARDAVVTDH